MLHAEVSADTPLSKHQTETEKLKFHCGDFAIILTLIWNIAVESFHTTLQFLCKALHDCEIYC